MAKLGELIRIISKYPELKALIAELRGDVDQLKKDPIGASVKVSTIPPPHPNGNGGGGDPDVTTSDEDPPLNPITIAGLTAAKNGATAAALRTMNGLLGAMRGAGQGIANAKVFSDPENHTGDNWAYLAPTEYSLAGIEEAKFYATGEAVNVFFRPQDGNTPAGWTNPSTPPENVDEWQLGYFWVTSAVTASTPSGAADAWVQYLKDLNPAVYGNGRWDTLIATEFDGLTPTQYNFWYYYDGGTVGTRQIVGRAPCSGQGVDLCPASNPALVTSYPIDFISQLIWDPLKAGFLANIFDEGINIKYKYPLISSKLLLQDEDGKPFTIQPTKNLGMLIYNYEDNNPANEPDTIRLYDSGMQLLGYLGAAQARLHLPFSATF